jgi:hypothetical protein
MQINHKQALEILSNPRAYNQSDLWTATAIVSAVNEVIERQWVSVKDDLPKHLETVWVSNGKGWTTLGCRIVSNEGWHWAESSGVVYQENDEIVAECESEDLDVEFWQSLPKPPKKQIA